MKESYYISAFCTGCNEPRYRSISSLVIGVDKFAPDLFVPVKPEIPPPEDGPALCYLCATPLRFIKEASGDLADPIPPRDSRAKTPDFLEVPREFAPTEVFRVEDGEEVLRLHERPADFLVITNRRILVIGKGA